MKLDTMLFSAVAALMLASAPAQASPPMAVKKLTADSRLHQRPAFDPNRDYTKLLKLPAPRFISMATPAEDAGLPDLIGGMIHSASWGETDRYGLYRLPGTSGEPFEFVCSGIYPNGGGVEAEGTYFSCEVEEGSDGYSIVIRAYDTETWRNTRSFSPGSDVSFIANDVAYDPVSGKIYGCLWDPEDPAGYMFGTIDYINGVTRKISTLENMWNAIAIDADGTIYAIDQEMEINGTEASCTKASLYKVNRETGGMTFVGDTGLKPYYTSTAVIDRRTGRMFWSVSPKEGLPGLYEVDKATGSCTLIYSYPSDEEFTGFYIPAPLAEDGAPAMPGNVEADFGQGSFSGTVEFDVPGLTYKGEEGTGDISYEIYANGIEVAKDATEWGIRQRANVTLRQAGENEIVVTLSNAAGVSPKAKLTIFAGSDVPKAPVVKAAWKDGVMTVSWETPEGSVNGGYIDPAGITYKVTRFPDGVVVAGAATGNSFTENIAETDEVSTYYYTVEATFDRKTSLPGVSNRVVLGAAKAPYRIDFSTVDNLDDVTIINVNPDSKGFRLSGGAAYLGEDRLLEKDDWIITAPIRLTPGYVYSVTVLASSQGTRYPEYAEIMMGDANTAEAMTEIVVPRTVVSTASASAWQTLSGYVTTDVERTVFIGVHACSPADVYNFRVSSIAVDPAFTTTAPGASTDFSVVPAADGSLRVDISLKAPTVDYDGNELSSISRLCLYRNGTLIFTKENPAPGESISHIDSDSQLVSGIYTYSAIAYRDDDPGREVKATVYVGVGIPAAVDAVSITETEPGKVKLTWAPVTKDKNGYQLSGNVTYKVYRPNADGTAWQIVESNISDTEFVVSEDPTVRQFIGYAVRACTSGGESDLTSSDFIAVGNPFELPYFESFADGNINTLYTYTGTSGDWSVTINNPEHLAQADDNGFALMTGEYYGSNSALISGKISLKGAQNPVLSFSTFNYYTEVSGPDHNNIDVFVCEPGGDWIPVKSIIVKDVADRNRWGIVSVDLNKYTDKTLQLMFKATNWTYVNTALDQIRINNGVDHNLSISALTAPESAEANVEFTLEAKVENIGLKDAGEFSVNLYRDGTLISSAPVESLRAGRQTDISFADSFNALVEDDVEYYASIVYTADMVESDNATDIVTVKPVLSALPGVPQLRGQILQGKAVLSWDEPDTDGAAPDPVTESFETAEPYAVTGQCGWTFVDVDGAPTQDASVALSTSAGYPNAPGIGDRSPLAWAVLDHDSGFASHYSMFLGHTGAKSLVAIANDMYITGAKINDDWAISPELFGGAQTITFWARSCSDDLNWGVEPFEILYSTSGTDIASFTKISDESVCSREWVSFSFSVPDGARYFAIRYVANDTYSMYLDDFTFIPAGASADLSLLGYHVYRNRVRITDEPYGDNVYTDEKAETGNHSYVVTALYDKGESRPSNVVVLGTSVIGDIASADLRIAVEARTITVSGAGGSMVSVVAVDGRVLAAGQAADIFSHTVASPGVYIVTVGSTSFKVVVK